jgi:hypothetical protein
MSVGCQSRDMRRKCYLMEEERGRVEDRRRNGWRRYNRPEYETGRERHRNENNGEK